jgi:hypothetical protein
MIYAIGLYDHDSWLRQLITTQFHTYTFFIKINIDKMGRDKLKTITKQ